MSRARSNRRRRPFDGDLCNCGRRWQDVPLGSTRSLDVLHRAGLDPDYRPDCWHPDEHPAGGQLGHRKGARRFPFPFGGVL